MSEKQSLRLRRKEKKRKESLRSKLIWGLIIIAVVVLIGNIIRIVQRPAEGVEFPLQDATHISESEALPEYNSNPPTSGRHYNGPLNRGFYDVEDIPAISAEPVGHLVHNLEHGYIILWYNCDIISEAECTTLKEELQDYLNGSLVPKQIAFPWSGTDFPVVLTSWGRMLEMSEFNASIARTFANANRLLAPEPNAP